MKTERNAAVAEGSAFQQDLSITNEDAEVHQERGGLLLVSKAAGSHVRFSQGEDDVSGDDITSDAAGVHRDSTTSRPPQQLRGGRRTRRQGEASKLIDARTYMFAVWADHIHENVSVSWHHESSMTC
jgi:hypothetical protein